MKKLEKTTKKSTKKEKPQNTKQTMFHRKLLCPKSGYDQHTNPQN
jgi:hypothetical protein